MTFLAETRLDVSVIEGPVADMRVFVSEGFEIVEPGILEDDIVAEWPPQMALLDVNVVANLQAQLTPAELQRVAPFVWRINGTVVPPHLILSSSFDLTPDGEDWSLKLAARADDPAIFEPYGDPVVTGCLPAGKDSVDLDIVYLTDAGPKSVRVMTDGIVENSSLDLETGIRSISGMGPRGRHVEKTVDYLLPTGHGKTRGEVAQELLTRAGVPDVALTGGSAMSKPVQAAGARAVQLADNILSAELLRLRWDADGDVAIVPMDVDGDADLTIDADTILAGESLTEDGNTDGPSVVVVTADTPVEREDGVRTEVTTHQVFKVWANQPAASSVGTDCSINNPPTAGLTPFLQKFKEVIHTRELDGDTVLSEKVETFRLNKWALSSHRRLNGTASASDYTCFFAWLPDPAGESRSTRSAFYRQVSETSTVKEFDDDGVLAKEVRETFGFAHPRAALKFRSSPATAWASVNFINNRWVMVNGEGVNVRNESFALLKRETVEYDVNELGLIEGQKTTVEEITRSPTGGAYLYADGTTSVDQAEKFQQSVEEEVTWTDLGNGQLQEVKSISRLGRWEDEELTIGPGELRAAEIKDSALPAAGAFDEEGEGNASFYESVPIEHKEKDPNLPDCREPRTDREHHDWIETQAEAEAFSQFRLKTGKSVIVRATIPVHAKIRSGQRVDVDLAPVGKKYELVVDRVTHDEPADGPSLTTLEGDHFLA